MMIYAIIEPIKPPASIPIYTPISPRPNGNANKHAKSKTKINSLMIVRPSETVPFPSPWNTFAAVAPNGTNNTNVGILLLVGLIGYCLMNMKIYMQFVPQRHGLKYMLLMKL